MRHEKTVYLEVRSHLRHGWSPGRSGAWRGNETRGWLTQGFTCLHQQQPVEGRFQEGCYLFLLQTPTSFLLVSSRDPKMWHCVCVSSLVVSDSLQPHMLQPTGPPVHGILQASTLEWVAISFSKRNGRKKESGVAQSCPTLCDPMNRSRPGSSVRGVFQARVLERGASSFPSVTLGFPNSISKMLLFLVCFYFSALIVLKS